MRFHAMTALAVSLACATTVALAAAPDAKEEAVKKDRVKYAGSWQVVSLEVDGNKANEEDAKKIIVINEADGKWSIELDGKAIARGTSEIDPTKKPKTIDLTITEGDGKGDTALAIYEIGDDMRKVCYAKPGMKRPEEFAAPAMSEHTLVVLKRLK